MAGQVAAVQGGQVRERDLAGADAPPEIGAIARDDPLAVSVAADDEGIAPAGAAVDAHRARGDSGGFAFQVDDAAHALSRPG